MDNSTKVKKPYQRKQIQFVINLFGWDEIHAGFGTLESAAQWSCKSRGFEYVGRKSRREFLCRNVKESLGYIMWLKDHQPVPDDHIWTFTVRRLVSTELEEKYSSWQKGKPKSAEARRKMRESALARAESLKPNLEKGWYAKKEDFKLRWIHNPTTGCRTRIKRDLPIPEGWVQGRNQHSKF